MDTPNNPIPTLRRSQADDDQLLRDIFLNLYGPGVLMGWIGQDTCTALADPELEMSLTISTNTANGIDTLIGCDEPGLAMACPVSCNTNFM